MANDPDFYDNEDDAAEAEDAQEHVSRNDLTDISDLDLSDALLVLRRATIKDLLNLIESGMATPADRSVAAKMLKDNGVILGDPLDAGKPGGANSAPSKAPLPAYTKPDYAD